ncbi:MAG: PfkB family carbohydrate kinase [Pseudomonadota bacterium]|nr:PfkB family carbohydrate kinase [Pseudomonadota bacterium]
MARILAVGIAALDIIQSVDGYPAEDAEVRALSRRQAPGGNAVNLLQMLGLLGHTCALAGILADDVEGAWVLAALREREIDMSGCRTVVGGRTPTSCVCLNTRNGSRTIVHSRALPEFGYRDFAGVPLEAFDWLHFEGRNVGETRRMIDRARYIRPGLPVSVEIEKSRPDIETLVEGVDVVLFSRDYALAGGHEDARSLLDSVSSPALLVCAWGESGAFARTPQGKSLFAPACPPAEVVDTLGAGDAFNAGFLDALLRGRSAAEALNDACRLAGAKCGMTGFAGLAGH